MGEAVSHGAAAVAASAGKHIHHFADFLSAEKTQLMQFLGAEMKDAEPYVQESWGKLLENSKNVQVGVMSKWLYGVFTGESPF